MEDMLYLDLSFLGLMSTLNGQHFNTAVYEEGPHYTRLSRGCTHPPIPTKIAETAVFIGWGEGHTFMDDSIDERGQKSGVLKSVVGIGDVDLSPARGGLYPFLALPTSL